MSFYAEKFVKAGRKPKRCCKCNKTIAIGESAYTIPGENFETTHDMCIPCYRECEELGIDYIEDVFANEEEKDTNSDDEDYPEDIPEDGEEFENVEDEE